jgi:hypothetical protein
VTTQGPAVSEIQQVERDQLDLRQAVPSLVSEDLDNESISSNIPEPPHSPRSELGIFTPSFDTRSEVSAASREPASPTSSRTDLTPVGIDYAEEPTVVATVDTLNLPAIGQDDTTPQSTPLAIVKDVPENVAKELVTRESAPEQKIKSIIDDDDTRNAPQIFPSSSNILSGEPDGTIHKK